MEGEREKNRNPYDEFFKTWADADPDIPILHQAKAEFKRLNSTAFAAAVAPGK